MINNSKNNNNNQSILEETKNIQRSTLEALRRTRKSVDDSTEVGTKTWIELQEQDQRLRKSEKDTTKLIDTLKKTTKVQNKFALWSGQWNNKQKAHTELQQIDYDEERSEGKQHDLEQQKTFKRRGKRPSKEDASPDMNNNSSNSFPDTTAAVSKYTKNLNNVVKESVQTSKDANTQVHRNELFGTTKITAGTTSGTATTKMKSTTTTKKKKERKRAKAASASAVKLSENDENELQNISMMDQLVDHEIDALGDQVNNLLSLSKQIGSNVTKQTTALQNIHTNLEETNDRTKVVNKRLNLFTRPRRIGGKK